MFTSVVQEEMKKEHEKEHEKELQAIRVSNTVHKHNLTNYIRFALCYAMLCPVLCYALSCFFTYDVTVCTDGSKRSRRKMCKTTSGTKGKSM